jgi:uncharacterized membrane protein YgdD (TMEM256/DUF423 family)
MRLAWIAGVLHALAGSTLLFLTLHPLRDALAPPELELMKIGAAWQAMQGLALMIVASATRARHAALLLAIGPVISMAMLSYIVFTGDRPPVIVAVPIGGGVTILGWIALLFSAPGKR